jgi:hypothetical protein
MKPISSACGGSSLTGGPPLFCAIVRSPERGHRTCAPMYCTTLNPIRLLGNMSRTVFVNLFYTCEQRQSDGTLAPVLEWAVSMIDAAASQAKSCRPLQTLGILRTIVDDVCRGSFIWEIPGCAGFLLVVQNPFGTIFLRSKINWPCPVVSNRSEGQTGTPSCQNQNSSFPSSQ